MPPCLRSHADNKLNPQRMSGRGRVRRQERRLPAEMHLAADSVTFAIRATTFVENGMAGFQYLESETGIRDDDLFRIKKVCPVVGALEHRHGTSFTGSHHFKSKSNSTVASDSSWSVPQRSSGRQVTHGTLSLRNTSRFSKQY